MQVIQAASFSHCMPPAFISVIVPVYKVEAFLQECIDSILAQTFTDFELILVDDGSPDNCGTICDQAAARDSRIRVIHQDNQGVTRARANGVAAAVGEFICFVDGDDTIPPHSLATLAEHANEETDAVVGGIRQHLHGGIEKNIKSPVGNITAEEYREICATHHNFYPSLWAKLFRRSLFTEEVSDIPRDIILGEDDIMNIRIAYRMRGKAHGTSTVVYNYRENTNSVTHGSHTLSEIIKAEKYKLNIIPGEDLEHFLPKGLAATHISYWFSRSRNRIIIPPATREYHRYLCSIMKYTNIRFGPISHILFYCTNPLIRLFIVPLYRIINAARRKA